MGDEHRSNAGNEADDNDDDVLRSLDAAMRSARGIAGDDLALPEPVADYTAHAPSRDELVADAVAGIADGAIPGARSGVLDVLSEWLLSATLGGDLPGVEAAMSALAQLTGSSERRRRAPRLGPELLEALAELRGASVALSWVGRLAAEVLVGAELVGAETTHGRMLTEIAARPGIGNNDLAGRLSTDKTQISRAGRKLLDSGLVAVSRSGPGNHWRVTGKGAALLRRQPGNVIFMPGEQEKLATDAGVKIVELVGDWDSGTIATVAATAFDGAGQGDLTTAAFTANQPPGRVSVGSAAEFAATHHSESGGTRRSATTATTRRNAPAKAAAAPAPTKKTRPQKAAPVRAAAAAAGSPGKAAAARKSNPPAKRTPATITDRGSHSVPDAAVTTRSSAKKAASRIRTVSPSVGALAKKAPRAKVTQAKVTPAKVSPTKAAATTSAVPAKKSQPKTAQATATPGTQAGSAAAKGKSRSQPAVPTRSGRP